MGRLRLSFGDTFIEWFSVCFGDPLIVYEFSTESDAESESSKLLFDYPEFSIPPKV
jgi:hypothetical protein